MQRFEEKAKVLRVFKGSLYGMAINNAGRVVLLNARDPSTVAMWDLAGETPRWERPVVWPYVCALGEDGTVYVGSRGALFRAPSELVVLEPDGSPGKRQTMPFAAISGLALTTDGRRLAAVGGEVSPGSDAQPRIFDLPELTGETAMPKVGDEAKLRWSEDGRWLVSATEKKTAHVFGFVACEPGKARPSWRGAGNAHAVRGNEIVTWTQTQTTRAEVALWSPAQKQPLRSASLQTPIGSKDCSIALIHGGSHLVVRTQAISIIDMSTLELVASFDYKYCGTSPQLDASPDGRYLLVNFGVQDRLWVVDSQSLVP